MICQHLKGSEQVKVNNEQTINGWEMDDDYLPVGITTNTSRPDIVILITSFC
jgi:hypothetical protein